LFKGKVLMITGGTGSFGRAVVSRFLETDIKEIRIFSRDEKKQEDMRILLSNSKLKFQIGDIRNLDSLEHATKGVDFIFHAAALKQVPSCEFYPMEAVRTNILGAENVMNASIKNNVKKVILLSTDKAVYPINAMGQSKAMMEKLMVAKSREMEEGETVFSATRYGNVMASRGSVIPLFISQIKQSQPITITDPAMTRYLMSLEESIDLVIHAFQHGDQGDIFVQKAPSSTVYDLAEALKSMFLSNSEVRIIGTRHGEKLYETLVSREEMSKVEDMGNYYRIPSDNRDLNYNKYFTDGEESIADLDDYTSHNTRRLSQEEIEDILRGLDYVRGELDA
jgi:UDP-N-acetylglucosamine 4,6-dehydratase